MVMDRRMKVVRQGDSAQSAAKTVQEIADALPDVTVTVSEPEVEPEAEAEAPDVTESPVAVADDEDAHSRPKAKKTRQKRTSAAQEGDEVVTVKVDPIAAVFDD